MTGILTVNKETLKNEFYTKYDRNDIMAKARVISAAQLNKIQPVYKTRKGQKDINNIVNLAVQQILTGDTDIQKVLDKAAKDWKSIEE